MSSIRLEFRIDILKIFTFKILLKRHTAKAIVIVLISVMNSNQIFADREHLFRYINKFILIFFI